MKKYIITLLLAAIICAPFSLSAQVTIGSDEAPRGFSVLELISNDERGLRLPRMTTPQRTALEDTPEFKAEAERAAMGLMIFNTTEGCLEVWNGSDWISLCMSVLPYLSVTPGAWLFAQPSGDAHTFTVSSNVTDTISVTGPLPFWATSITINQVARTFTITTTAANGANPRTPVNLTVAVGELSTPVTISQMGTNADGLVMNASAFVGAFWRNDQRGERLIRIPSNAINTVWSAFAVTADGGDWIQLDRGVPGNMMTWEMTGNEHTLNPEDFPLPASAGNFVQSPDTGGNIYFRIGLRTTNPNPVRACGTRAPRYGQVLIRHNWGIHVIWIRQGCAADYLMRPQDYFGAQPRGSGAVRWSPFNLTAYDLNAQVATQAQQLAGVPEAQRSRFTDYPTQSGAKWQWASSDQPRRAYSPLGGLPAGIWGNMVQWQTWWANDLGPENESCPPGWRRPTDGVGTGQNHWIGTDAMARLSEVRMSLISNPQLGDLIRSNANSVQGSYADGFFDRREIVAFIGSGVPNSVALTDAPRIAHRGVLFFNPASGQMQSLFLPFGLSRNHSGIGGAFIDGGWGYYWTSTQSTVTDSSGTRAAVLSLRIPAHSGGEWGRDRVRAHMVRCIREK